MAIVVKGLVVKVVLAIVADVLAIRVATSVVDLVGLIKLTTTNSLVIIGFEDGTISFAAEKQERAERSWSGSLQVSPIDLHFRVKCRPLRALNTPSGIVSHEGTVLIWILPFATAFMLVYGHAEALDVDIMAFSFLDGEIFARLRACGVKTDKR